MPANHVYAVLCCPKCGHEADTEIEADVDGRGFAKDYKIGDNVDWLPRRSAESDTLTTDGYLVCNKYHRGFFVKLFVVHSKIVVIEVDTEREGYIS